MLETMLALKNNDMRKIPGYDPQPVEKLRKLQRALVSDTLFWFVLSLHAIMDSLSTVVMLCPAQVLKTVYL